MKKAALLLLLFFPGCLAATGPIGANKEAGRDGDKSAVADNFLSPPPSAEPPPVDVPAAPPGAPPPSDVPAPTPIPLMRSLPGGDDAAGGDSFAGDRALAYISPGPIDPKTDQGQAEGLPCATHHMKYGPNFSSTVWCFAKTPLFFSDPNKPLSFTFLLEKKLEGDDPNTSPVWVPETGGLEVRLVYQPAGKEAWESSYVDAVTDANGIVDFSGIPAAAGSIFLSFLKSPGTTPPYPHSELEPFASREVYEAFMNPPLLVLDFNPVGNFQLTQQMSTAPGELRRLVVPPPSAPPQRVRFLPPKDIFPSEP